MFVSETFSVFQVDYINFVLSLKASKSFILWLNDRHFPSITMLVDILKECITNSK